MRDYLDWEDPALSRADRVQKLLMRYPEVSPTERDVIGRFLASAPSAEVALLSANAASLRKIAQFRSDNPDYFSFGLRAYLEFVALGLAFSAVSTGVALSGAEG